MTEENQENQETPIHQFYFDTLKFCGCGNPEDVLDFLRQTLSAIRDRSSSRDRENTLLPLDSPLALTYRYWLDAQGWTEHGGSVYGAWLTKEGKEVLVMLEAADDLEEAVKGSWEKDWEGDSSK